MTQNKIKRCAVYTRKSHEEGLEQEFNSLDAQRESAVAFIQAQKHEGWQLVETHYDDGGYSGGTMQRPALKQLLTDIEAGHVDVVVVYKVDRLSRSLADFAQMVQLFEQHNVSFVSVTQQFNTTTSMGRLTLNVLLSFAQFEREVTGERIRDKIAASKRKGMWMGGRPPLGYRNEDRKLFIIESEATAVKAIYQHYQHTQSLLQTAQHVNELGYRTKVHCGPSGQSTGGKPFNQKSIYKVLVNPVYSGQMAHKGTLFTGQHVAIIDLEQWERIQRMLKTNTDQGNDTGLIDKPSKGKTRHRWVLPYLLKGKLRTHTGHAMSPTSVHRPGKKDNENNGNTDNRTKIQLTRTKRLVPYYVSQLAIQQGYKHCELKSLNAQRLDELVRGLVGQTLCQYEKETAEQTTASPILDYLQRLPQAEQDFALRQLIQQVLLAPDQLSIRLDKALLHQWLAKQAMSEVTHEHSQRYLTPLPECVYQPTVINNHDQLTVTAAIQIKRCDGKRVITDDKGRDLIVSEVTPSTTLLQAIAKGMAIQKACIEQHISIGAWLKQHPVSPKVRQYVALAYLSPTVIKCITVGKQPSHWTVKRLLEAARLPIWSEQHQLLGLEH